MSGKMKWKDALLFSGMPLEFEAARLLISEGFNVNADFRYTWSDADALSNSGTDLHAKTDIPFSESGPPLSQMEILVDCKHRDPRAVGLFLPDLNPSGASPVSPGNTVRVIDQFSPCVVSSDALVSFEMGMPVCYKGMEVNTDTGEVDESLFKQSLWQLQSPLPRLMTENIFLFLTGPVENNIPFLFCPVLLTTAPLFVMRKETALSQIENADQIEDVAVRTPYLIMSSGLSPDFKSTCVEESKQLRTLLRTDKAMAIEMKKARYYNSHFNLPFTIIDALNASEYYYLNHFFTQFFICSHTAFPEFVRVLKKTAETVMKTRQELA
ncbi:hypothetical protein DENIS_1494 [Desulfonema ishimotonii]|uniref:Uncharacterized protein n=1 Tax=Desulfonema ishimotonii TaxID=45657 RepID=A0A401FU76_9BACT|nr:hypothetical protein [Desulfonema ishimotonii]GBC60537.1 hypothetical protein DENIS_1494 [Desulfonema ishimotonii]